MKKVALSLLALALVGAGAFAQDAAAPAFKIGGYLDVGTLTVSKADSGASTIIKGDDSGKVGGSYEFRGSYGTDKSGVVINVRAENLTAPLSATTSTAIDKYGNEQYVNTSPRDAFGYPTTSAGYVVGSTSLGGTIFNVQDLYTWFKLPGLEAVKLTAGQFGNAGTAWNPVDDWGTKRGLGTGVNVQVTPQDGFTFGGTFIPALANNSGTAGIAAPVVSGGVTYTVPSTVLIQGAVATADKAYSEALDSGYVGGQLLLAGPLSVKGDFNFFGASLAGSYLRTLTDVTIGYAITDAFSATLLTYVYTYGGDEKYGTDSASLSAKINPSIGYVVDPVTSVGLGGTYYVGNGAGILPTTATTAPIANKLTGIEINPNATFTIDANAKIYVNYLYDSLSGDDKPAKDASWSTFKVDYRYTF